MVSEMSNAIPRFFIEEEGVITDPPIFKSTSKWDIISACLEAIKKSSVFELLSFNLFASIQDRISVMQFVNLTIRLVSINLISRTDKIIPH